MQEYESNLQSTKGSGPDARDRAGQHCNVQITRSVAVKAVYLNYIACH